MVKYVKYTLELKIVYDLYSAFLDFNLFCLLDLRINLYTIRYEKNY